MHSYLRHKSMPACAASSTATMGASRTRRTCMAAQRDKVIVTCAVTGSIHTPTMSPHLPIIPLAIADAAIGAAEAGAAIIHLHARDPRTGKPTPDPEVFGEFLPMIAGRTDAVINITRNRPHGITLQQPVAP